MAENKFLDDIAKFGNTTLTAMSGMQKQVRKWAGEQVNIAIENMDLATKKELDAYKGGITKLQSRLDELEKKLAKSESKAKPQSPKAKSKKPKAK